MPVVSSSMAPMILDESKLIDLPTEEGRRRGNELLSLLSETWLFPKTIRQSDRCGVFAVQKDVGLGGDVRFPGKKVR